MHSWDNMNIFFKDSKLQFPPPPPPPLPPPTTNKTRLLSRNNASSNTNATKLESTKSEELQRLVHAPPFCNKNRLSRQLSMCETTNRDVAWEKRRRKKIKQEKMNKSVSLDVQDLTDEDLHELKGSIELGFGFKEEEGQKLCNTLPALDFYFAVNRQLSTSPESTPHSQGLTRSMRQRSLSFESAKSEDSWKILGPGDNPQQVKTKLRHWAQAVACSVIQST